MFMHEMIDEYIKKHGVPQEIQDLTAKIHRLESADISNLSPEQRQAHEQELRDAFFCRRRKWERAVGAEVTSI